jgi:hypothetical protein
LKSFLNAACNSAARIDERIAREQAVGNRVNSFLLFWFCSAKSVFRYLTG